jgi:hypothetical protein
MNDSSNHKKEWVLYKEYRITGNIQYQLKSATLHPTVKKMKDSAYALINKGDMDGLLALYWIMVWMDIKPMVNGCPQEPKPSAFLYNHPGEMYEKNTGRTSRAFKAIEKVYQLVKTKKNG